MSCKENASRTLNNDLERNAWNTQISKLDIPLFILIILNKYLITLYTVVKNPKLKIYHTIFTKYFNHFLLQIITLIHN